MPQTLACIRTTLVVAWSLAPSLELVPMLPSPVWSLWSCHHHGLRHRLLAPPQGVGQRLLTTPSPELPPCPPPPHPCLRLALGVTAGLGRVGGSICLPCHASWGLCPQPGTPAPTEPAPNPRPRSPRPAANSAASLLCSNPSSARARAHPRLAGGEAAEAGGTRGEAEAVLRHLQNPHLLVLRSSPRRLRPAGGLLPVRPRARGAAAGAPHQEEASSLSGRAGGLRPGRGRGRGPRLPPGSLGPTTPCGR